MRLARERALHALASAYFPLPLSFTFAVRRFGSLLVISTMPCAAPFAVGANSIVTAVEPCGLTRNSPPLSGNGTPCDGIVATSVTFPAFLIRIVRGAEWLPTATLPNVIDCGLSFSLPPGSGVGVAEGVAVAVAVGVAVVVADAVAVAVAVIVAVGEDVAVALAVGVGVGVGAAIIPS